MAAERRTSRVYQVLAKPRLILGQDFPFLVMNMAIAAVMVLDLHVYWWLFITFIIHKVLQAIGRNDPLMRRIFLVYSKQADRYDPWPSVDAVRGLRPRDFGRGSLR